VHPSQSSSLRRRHNPPTLDRHYPSLHEKGLQKLVGIPPAVPGAMRPSTSKPYLRPFPINLLPLRREPRLLALLHRLDRVRTRVDGRIFLLDPVLCATQDKVVLPDNVVFLSALAPALRVMDFLDRIICRTTCLCQAIWIYRVPLPQDLSPPA
jgi:hypothetical protein